MNMVSVNRDPNPFIDNFDGGDWIREFEPDKTEHDFVWHRDREDRVIVVLEGSNWKFQFDNELPFCINKGDELFVPKMVYHRIIPGTTPLRIKIDEMVETVTKLAIA